MKPHVHADVIKAWADGAEIEWKYPKEGESGWTLIEQPSWSSVVQYRVKPVPKFDFFKYVEVHPDADIYPVYEDWKRNTNLRLTFDGETKKLKNAEVVG